MNQDNKIYLLSDVELNETQLKQIKDAIELHTTPQEKKNGDKNGYPLILIQRIIIEALTYNYLSEEDKNSLRFAQAIISTKLRKWVFRKDSFNFMGEVSNEHSSTFDNEKYFIIEASCYKEALEIRDELEADSFQNSSIQIKDLLTIINNMERIHGSSGINPTKLKELIKG